MSGDPSDHTVALTVALVSPPPERRTQAAPARLDTRAIVRMLDAMAQDLETLQLQVEQLTTAVQALTSLTRTPQERLDRAISYFSRTFREDPTGHAFALWRRIYKAIGDPPVGITLAVKVDSLTAEEQETITQALVELAAEVQKTCWEAERTAGQAAQASSA